MTAAPAVSTPATGHATTTAAADQRDVVEPCTHPGLRPAVGGRMRTYPYADHPDADLVRWAH